MDPECKKACDEFRAEFGWDLIEEMAKEGCAPPDADYVRRMADRERVAISEWAAKLNKFN
jgi:hypothetical protein